MNYKIKMKNAIWLLFCINLISCTGIWESSSMRTPAPSQTEYFTTTGAGFTGTSKDGRLIDLHYALTLRLNKHIDKDLLVNVCFENPAVPGSPLCHDEILPKTQSKISLESPVVYGLVDRTNYGVNIKIYDPDKTKLLGTHRQAIRYYDIRY
jgi:hypothetical protein